MLFLFVCYSPEKARAVVVPLLTSHGVELLENCLSSKETEVWKSLGPNWNMTKYVDFCLLFTWIAVNRTKHQKLDLQCYLYFINFERLKVY